MDVEIVNDDHDDETTNIIGESESKLMTVKQTLRLDNAHIDDNDHFECQAENSVGKISEKISINIHCKFCFLFSKKFPDFNFFFDFRYKTFF